MYMCLSIAIPHFLMHVSVISSPPLLPPPPTKSNTTSTCILILHNNIPSHDHYIIGIDKVLINIFKLTRKQVHISPIYSDFRYEVYSYSVCIYVMWLFPSVFFMVFMGNVSFPFLITLPPFLHSDVCSCDI